MTLPWIGEYDSLKSGAGLVDFSDRTQVEVLGEDRATFLHSFCTNEIRKLALGTGCEAFLTSVQGKTLSHVNVFAWPESLVLETVPEQGPKIVEHLDRYIIRERVTLADRSSEWAEQLLAGAEAESVLKQLTENSAPPQNLACVATEFNTSGGPLKVWVRRIDLINAPSFIISCASEDLQQVSAALVAAGAMQCSREAFEAARIEAGTPLFGHDITDKNLPQEVNRDRQAISFTKGCYLGQETVARLDALGHVNKLLAGVRFFEANVPPPGTELTSDGQKAGDVTSSTWSPALGAPLSLAYVRSGKHAPGTRLESSFGPAEVVSLPIASRSS